MAKYINREATIDALDSRDEYDDLVNTIREQPVIDMQPVPATGEYIRKKDIIRHLCLTTGCSYSDEVIGAIMRFPGVRVDSQNDNANPLTKLQELGKED